MFKIFLLINFFISITVTQVISNQLINKIELEQIPDVVPYIESNQKNELNQVEQRNKIQKGCERYYCIS